MSYDPQTEIDFEREAWCNNCRSRFEILFTGHTDSAYAHGQCPECDAVITAERDVPRDAGGRRRLREVSSSQASARAEARAAMRVVVL